MNYRPYVLQNFEPDDGEAPSEPTPPRAALPDPEDFQEGFGPANASGAEFQSSEHTGGDETDFASIKFQRENTLLTNAENYAASIREEAELYVRQLRSEAEALDQETQQRYEEAHAAKEAAEEEAARIIAEAQAQADEVREQAQQEGFAAGQEEGRQQRYEEAGPLLGRLEQVLEQAENYRGRLQYHVEQDGIRLALLMARKILRSELKINRKAVLKLLAATLADLQGTGVFRVWLNPEDHEFALAARPALERYLDAEQTLTLRARPDLAPGNMLIETDREVIDLTFESQFYHLDRVFNQALSEREAVLQRGGRRPEERRRIGEPPAGPKSRPAGKAPGGAKPAAAAGEDGDE